MSLPVLHVVSGATARMLLKALSSFQHCGRHEREGEC